MLVKSLHERYLWVDQLCIVQNDESEKMCTISFMKRIYKAALLTIVAAEGTNLTSGLAGVRPSSRYLSPVSGIVDGIGLVHAEPVISVNNWHSPTVKSPWNFRAWTYQEHVLSLRLMFLLLIDFTLSVVRAAAGKTNQARF